MTTFHESKTKREYSLIIVMSYIIKIKNISNRKFYWKQVQDYKSYMVKHCEKSRLGLSNLYSKPSNFVHHQNYKVLRIILA